MEDEPAITQGIERLLAPIAPVRVAATEEEALQILRTKDRLNFVMIDVQLGKDAGAGLRVLDAAVKERPDTRRALLTGSRDASAMWYAAQRGAAFLPKPFEPDVLMELVELASPVPANSLDAFVERRCRTWRLAGKQARVVAMAVEGRTRADIAATLGIEETTAATYVRRLLQKTGHASLGQLGLGLLREYAEEKVA